MKITNMTSTHYVIQFKTARGAWIDSRYDDVETIEEAEALRAEVSGATRIVKIEIIRTVI